MLYQIVVISHLRSRNPTLTVTLVFVGVTIYLLAAKSFWSMLSNEEVESNGKTVARAALTGLVYSSLIMSLLWVLEGFATWQLVLPVIGGSIPLALVLVAQIFCCSIRARVRRLNNSSSSVREIAVAKLVRQSRDASADGKRCLIEQLLGALAAAQSNDPRTSASLDVISQVDPNAESIHDPILRSLIQARGEVSDDNRTKLDHALGDTIRNGQQLSGDSASQLLSVVNEAPRIGEALSKWWKSGGRFPRAAIPWLIVTAHKSRTLTDALDAFGPDPVCAYAGVSPTAFIQSRSHLARMITHQPSASGVLVTLLSKIVASSQIAASKWNQYPREEIAEHVAYGRTILRSVPEAAWQTPDAVSWLLFLAEQGDAEAKATLDKMAPSICKQLLQASLRSMVARDVLRSRDDIDLGQCANAMFDNESTPDGKLQVVEMLIDIAPSLATAYGPALVGMFKGQLQYDDYKRTIAALQAAGSGDAIMDIWRLRQSHLRMPGYQLVGYVGQYLQRHPDRLSVIQLCELASHLNTAVDKLSRRDAKETLDTLKHIATHEDEAEVIWGAARAISTLDPKELTKRIVSRVATAFRRADNPRLPDEASEWLKTHGVAGCIKPLLPLLGDPKCAAQCVELLEIILKANIGDVSLTRLKSISKLSDVQQEEIRWDRSEVDKWERAEAEFEALCDRFEHSDELPITGRQTDCPLPKEVRVLVPLKLTSLRRMAEKELARRRQTSP